MIDFASNRNIQNDNLESGVCVRTLLGLYGGVYGVHIHRTIKLKSCMQKYNYTISIFCMYYHVSFSFAVENLALGILLFKGKSPGDSPLKPHY